MSASCFAGVNGEAHGALVDESEVDFTSVAIADPRAALTFARVKNGDESQVILVRKYERGFVSGLDLSLYFIDYKKDPIDLFKEYGYERLRDLILKCSERDETILEADALSVPVDLVSHHVAVGANYRDHAEETGEDLQPFLFPKIVEPTGPYSSINAKDYLLDHEVELAFVSMSDIKKDGLPEYMGLMLANDYTDRESLLRNVDPSDIESGKGFAIGKSYQGFLPVGNLFVVPRDWSAFVERLKLKLYVRSSLKQQSSVRNMVWSVEDIIQKTFEIDEKEWDFRGHKVGILPRKNVIGERTLILTGTPQGTIFNGVSWTDKLSGVMGWLLDDEEKDIQQYAIDAYSKRSRARGVYLASGDRVISHVDYLGLIQNRIY